MKIGVIQASSQAAKNDILYNTAKETARGHEVINFGCFADEKDTYSYIEIAFEAGLLLSSGALDFIVILIPNLLIDKVYKESRLKGGKSKPTVLTELVLNDFPCGFAAPTALRWESTYRLCL